METNTALEAIEKHYSPKSILGIILDQLWENIIIAAGNMPTKKGNNTPSSTGICGVHKTGTGRYKATYKLKSGIVVAGIPHIGKMNAALDRQALENKYGTTPNSNVEKWLEEDQ